MGPRHTLPTLLLLFLLIGCHSVRATYPCVCNYNVEQEIFSSADVDSGPVGYVYEFDCKEWLSLPGIPDAWMAIAFEHKVGYIQKNSAINKVTCDGEPSTDDTVTSTIRPKTSTSKTVESSPISAAPSSMSQAMSSASNSATVTSIPVTAITATATDMPITAGTLTSRTISTIRTSTPPTVASSSGVQSQTLHTLAGASTAGTSSPGKTTADTSSGTNLPAASTSSVGITTDDRPSAGTSFVETTSPGSITIDTSSASRATADIGTTSPLVPVSFSVPTTIHPTLLPISTTMSTTPTTMSTRPLTTPTATSAKPTGPVIAGNIGLCPTVLKTYTREDGGGLTQYGGSCYELVPTSLIWTKAELDCRAKGGNLLRVPNEATQQFIVTWLNSFKFTRPVWMGLNDHADEEYFTWISDPYNPAYYTNWYPGHTSQGNHFMEDCVVLRPGSPYHGQWDDVGCGETFPTGDTGQQNAFICEFSGGRIRTYEHRNIRKYSRTNDAPQKSGHSHYTRLLSLDRNTCTSIGTRYRMSN